MVVSPRELTWLLEPSEGLQAPLVSHTAVAQNVQVVIICPHLEKRGIGPIPLIKNFLDHVFPVAELKPYGPFVRLSSCIRLHP
jgi:hypothetical protein